MSDDDRDRQIRDMFQQFFGDQGDELLEQMRARGIDPAKLSGDGPLPGPGEVQSILNQVRRVLSDDSTGPVNTVVAHELARQVAIAEGDPALTGTQAQQGIDALRVAELWLDAATTLPPSAGPCHAWTRTQWVEATLPAWHRLAAPVAASMSNALATVLGEHLGADAEVSLLLPGNPAGLSLEAIGLGDLDPAALLRRLGAAAFGMQIGQAAGTLSREAFGATDLGLPLLAGPGTVLVPANVDAFAGGLSAPIEEVRLFLAVREAAHARLFTHVPWAAGHLLGLVESYARGITIDLNSLEEQVRDIDPANPEELHMAIARGGVFGVPPTADQQATLLRLETALALVEGWVDEVSAQATLAHLPHAIALREMLRRRRAAGGPAEQTFSALVGLELRPRRCRDAASLFAHAYTAGGIEGRDGVWSHPDLLPTPADLDDPAGYLTRREADRMLSDALDDALEDLLRGEEP